MVRTSTNVRYLTALPAHLSVKAVLPRLFNRYCTVLAENMGREFGHLPRHKITKITTRDCLIAGEELLGEIFKDGDDIFITIEKEKDEKYLE
jgi:hypothetical protein